jgi:hypothetical protein
MLESFVSLTVTGKNSKIVHLILYDCGENEVMRKATYSQRRLIYGLVVCAFLCSFVSCRRVGPLYIEAPVKEPDLGTVRLHLFFDKTESMRGFTAKGDDSQYVQTLPLLWQIGLNAFAASEARFFDYGEQLTNEFTGTPEEVRDRVRKRVLKPEFYPGNTQTGDDGRVKIWENNRLPFSGIAKFIWKLDDEYDKKPGSIYIVVTDLYEQNMERPFSKFFSDAFTRGLSGALFAVESTFSGVINSVSYVNNDTVNIPVRDGISTFFICIVGDSDIVYAYSAELSKELSNKKINFHDAVFVVNAPQEVKPHHGEPIMATNARNYGKSENALRLLNLRSQAVYIINQTSTDRIESYQVLTDVGSRWAAGLPLKNINTDNFKYKAESSLYYFNGEKAKTEGNKPVPSPFVGKANSTIASAKVVNNSNIDNGSIQENGEIFPVYILIETDNEAMEKGWYRIKYDIVPEAIQRPDWVSGLNAENVGTLQESASVAGGRVKVLELANVYEKIADAYNKQTRSIFSDEIYLVKK